MNFVTVGQLTPELIAQSDVLIVDEADQVVQTSVWMPNLNHNNRPKGLYQCCDIKRKLFITGTMTNFLLKMAQEYFSYGKFIHVTIPTVSQILDKEKLETPIIQRVNPETFGQVWHECIGNTQGNWLLFPDADIFNEIVKLVTTNNSGEVRCIDEASWDFDDPKKGSDLFIHEMEGHESHKKTIFILSPLFRRGLNLNFLDTNPSVAVFLTHTSDFYA